MFLLFLVLSVLLDFYIFSIITLQKELESTKEPIFFFIWPKSLWAVAMVTLYLLCERAFYQPECPNEILRILLNVAFLSGYWVTTTLTDKN